MMPLAFDLISTFVIGSMRPVATTERAMAPRSTVANREESISVVGRDITTKPVTPKPLRMTSAPSIHKNLRGFFFILFDSVLFYLSNPGLINDYSVLHTVFWKRRFRK